MNAPLAELLTQHRETAYLLLRRVRALGSDMLGGSELGHVFDHFRRERGEDRPVAPGVEAFVRTVQEVVVRDPILYLWVRESVARWRYLQVHAEDLRCSEISVSEYLTAKERLVTGPQDAADFAVEIDLEPFERSFPRLTQARSIGRGVEHLNRYLSGRLFQEPRGPLLSPAARDALDAGGREGARGLLEFLRLHHLGDQPLMLNGSIESVGALRSALRSAVGLLEDAGAEGWSGELRGLGFEPGWGRTSERARDTMELLLDILEAPEPRQLSEFLARIPLITSIVILSPHGYFGQSNVLGKPDTGGQVVYILDQVRALENAMRASLYEQGISVEPRILVVTRLIPDAGDTTCDQRLEPILGTESAAILRVPFRNPDGEVVRPWISRFEIWPYLERFAVDAERDVKAELGMRPDMIIGNYSDGNLVASLMSRRMGVTQCNIAHALEKTKYAGADLRWEEHEGTHHFACQFTADLIAMNTADFIITSTYQEIAGTDRKMGQYESYRSFTLPGLYRVVSGIDCFDPKFNVVSPGANPDVFFPYDERARRMPELTAEVRELAFGAESGDTARGRLTDLDRPTLFAISRLDEVKNMAGLLEGFARSQALRDRANLLLVGGWLDPERSGDPDERAQIERMHRLFEEHGLDEGGVRWVEMQTDKNRVGELYRVVADTRGAFVQPALFEAFGLTVIEAMSCGLPVFATCFGGPSEIVEHGVSGYQIDPTAMEEAVAVMTSVIDEFANDPAAWERVSQAGIERVRQRYSWDLYASRLLELSRVYGFWKFMSSLDRDEPRRYLEMFYGLMYRPLAERVARSGGDGCDARSG